MDTAPVASNRTLARVQAWSGLAFALFLSVHLLNTAVAPLGQATYDAYQHAARRAYQPPPVEALVLLAAAVHMGAGLARWRRRRSAGSARAAAPWRLRLHRWSGYYMLAAFAGHVLATRGPTWFFGTPIEFSFLTFSLEYWPAMFYPYYALLFASGFYHLVHGVPVALRLAGVRAPAPNGGPAFWGAIGGGVLVGLLAVAGLGGRLFEIDRGRYADYMAFWDRVYPAALRPWAR